MLAVLYHSITSIRTAASSLRGIVWLRLLYQSLLATATRTQSMTNEGDLSLITCAVITVLPDKITVTLHAQLLILLAMQIGYLCSPYRCGETENKWQRRLIAALLTFLGGIFFVDLIYKIKMDLLAEVALEQISFAVNATQMYKEIMYSSTCNYTQTVHRSIHRVIVNQVFM